jgi:hypothetical protein
MTRLVDEIDALHARYAEAVNLAVADDDLTRAEELAAAYDAEATALIADREGLTHLLPQLTALRRQGQPDSRLRTLVRRLARHRAA